MKRIRHTKIDKPTATAATHHLTAATPSVGGSAVSGVIGGHHSAAAQAAALFGLPAHQLSSLSALQGVSGASSSQFAAHHHMSTAAAAMSAASTGCTTEGFPADNISVCSSMG